MRKTGMHLVAYLKTGPTAIQTGTWRHPDATIDDICSPERYEHIARVLEAGKFDACFFADLSGVYDVFGDHFGLTLERAGQNSFLDPVTVLPIMARVTEHLGLAATISTSFHHPYHLARTLGSLDLLSGGRIAWNAVTSTTDLEAQNFGSETLLPKDQRYDLADEVMEACFSLWDGWDADAMVLDKEKGVLVDPAKVHYSNYAGKLVSSRGPLPNPRSPQDRPMIMQAGSSPRGKEFGARWGEIIFAGGASNKAKMQASYKDMKERVAAAGRDPDDCRILAAVTVAVGRTEEEARAQEAMLDNLRDGELSVAMASAAIGIDLAKLTEEADLSIEVATGMHESAQNFLRLMREEGLTAGEAAKKLWKQDVLAGTPETICDTLQDLFESEACDGFIILPTIFPTCFEEFVELVVPELQKRKIFRTEYRGKTLRENIRLA